MGLTLLVLLLQLSPADSLAGHLDPEQTTQDVLDSLDELTTWHVLTQASGSHRARLALKHRGFSAAFASRSLDSKDVSGYFAAALPGAVNVIAGDLRPSFGAGLMLGTPRFGTPETSGLATQVRRPRLKGYSGTATTSRIRGLAAVLESESVYVGAFSSGQTLGAAIERRAHAIVLGAAAVRSSAGSRKMEAWVRTNLGPARVEAAATPRSAVGAVKLTPRRSGPTLQLAARRYSALGNHAAPPRLRSGRGASEEGLTLAGRWPTGRGSVSLAVDHSTDKDDVQERMRLSLTSRSTDIRIDRRLRTSRTALEPEALRLTSNSEEWRIRASQQIPGNPSINLEAFFASKDRVTSSYLRFRIHLDRGPAWRFDAAIVEFQTQPGGPVMAVYEASPDGAFPIIRLTGEGRRLSIRITRSGKRARARLACSWHSRKAPDARQGPDSTTECAFSLSG
jgi:hypothetical protein